MRGVLVARVPYSGEGSHVHPQAARHFTLLVVTLSSVASAFDTPSFLKAHILDNVDSHRAVYRISGGSCPILCGNRITIVA